MLRRGSGCSVGSVLPGYIVFVLESHPQLLLERIFSFLYVLYLAPVLVFCFYLYCVMLHFPVHVHAARAIFAVSEY